MTTVLLEPFDTLAAWAGTATLRTGRTGIGATVAGSSTLSYTIAAGSESDTAIVGFGYRIDTLAAARSFLTLRSDAGATNHVTVTVNTDGSVDVKRGGTAGSVIGSSAPAGTIAINVWYFIELRAVLSDTVGAFSLRVNGAVVASGTNVDTKNLGTKTTFDTLTLQGGGSGSNNTYDDLYLRTGSAETFQGDVVQGSCNDVLREPFEALTNWVLTGNVPTVGAGRTNNAMQVRSTGTATYTIPSGSEAYEVTIGFALFCAGNLSTSDFLWFKSDAGATDHLRVRVGTTGGLSVLRGGTSISGASSATGVIVLSTWQYVEVQVIVHDTAGSITIRVNGTVVLSTTNVDTKNAGTKSTIDTIQLNGVGSGITNATGAYFDDLYLLTGTTCAFLGDITIGASPTGTAAMVFGGTATGGITFPGAGTATVVFGASATGAIPSFSGGGQAAMAFGATAIAVLVLAGSASASIEFSTTATPAGVISASGQAHMIFSATATATVITAFGASASLTFAITAGTPTNIPVGAAVARASLDFLPAVTEVEFIYIGRASVIPQLGTTVGPITYASPAWAPAPDSVIGVIMAVPAYSDDTTGPFAGLSEKPLFFITDSFGATSDWNAPVNYYVNSALAAFPALWQLFCAYARTGPNPVPGLVNVTFPFAPNLLSATTIPDFDHHAFFFELRGVSHQHPVGRVGVGAAGTFDIDFGGDQVYNPPGDSVTVPMSDPPVEPENDPLPVNSSSVVIGLVNQQLTQPAIIVGDTGREVLVPVQPFTMSAPHDWATLDQVPVVNDAINASSHALLAYRNTWAAPSNTWLGETALVPTIDASGTSPIVIDGWPIVYVPQQFPLMALAVEFRSAVLDPAPPVVTEFGVWVQGAGGEWFDRTCDIRSIDIERGRNTYTDGFAAATLSLSLSNFEGVYSAWNPASIWSQYGGKYQVGIPIQVWGYTGGVATAMFTGTTDSVIDSWPGTVDALAVVQATDAFKGFARHTSLPLPGEGWIGLGEYSGQRVHRYATDAGFTGPRAIDTGWTRMQATTMEGNSMDKMREVGESEWGWLFIDEAGTLVFRQRDALQTDLRMTDAQWVFTDSHLIPATTLPVVCYQEPLQFSVDEASIINIAQIQDSPPPTGAIGAESGASAHDDDSLAHYGPRTWTRTLPIYDGALGVAQVVVMEYSDDDKHIQALTFSALTNDEHRDAATNVRINDRIKVYRHYPGGYVLRQDLLVQGIHHTIVPSGNRDHDPSRWDVTIRTATAALIINFGRWDDPSPDDEGLDHGWDTQDQWGI